jgi:hypothetical protein
MIILVLLGTFSTLQIGVVTSNPSEVALIEVSATSPHVANGTDPSSVVVTAKDVNGVPVIGADILIYLSDGEDSIWTFTPTDNGDGTYSVLINLTESGRFNLAAVDLTTGVTGTAQVIFESGPITDIFMDYSKPRESESKNTSEVIAVPRDIFGNTILLDKADITIITDLGTTSPTTFETGAFRTNVTSDELGFANVTAIDKTTGINKTIVVPFPAMYIGPPNVLVLVGSTFSVPLYVFVSNPGRALGFYDLNISFNSSMIEFVNITDGDPNDEFDTPLINVFDNNTIRISQINVVSNVTPTGEVNICNITFCAQEAGFAPINMTLWNDSPQSLLDTDGTPLPSTPNIGEDPVVHMKKKETCLKIHVVKNCVNLARVNADIEYAKKVFEGAKARANCSAIEIKTCDIDPINIDELEEINAGGLVFRSDPKDNKLSSKLRQLLSTNPKPNCVNIYYVKKIRQPPAWGVTIDGEHFPSETNHGIVISEYADTRTMAHELAHFLIKYPYNQSFAEHNIQKADGTDVTLNQFPPDNILAVSGRATAKKAEDEDLWKDQCEKMKAHDFGDAPDPDYPSLKKNQGASHFNSIYEWLGARVDDELDSRQIDEDKFDDGIEQIPPFNWLPGQKVSLSVKISTSGEPGRYDSKNKDKVMYLNAWIDWNKDGIWADPAEKIIGTNSPTGTGTQKFSGSTIKRYFFQIPEVKSGSYWMRIRLDYAEDAGKNPQNLPGFKTDPSLNGPKGQAMYGEVEDHKISISPILKPIDTHGSLKYVFPEHDPVYVTGDWYPANTTLPIYIVNNITWTDCTSIPHRVPETVTTVTTNGTGQIPPTKIWTCAFRGAYDIIVDVDNDGLYNATTDALVDNNIDGAGFVVVLPPRSPVANFTEYPETPYVYQPVYFDASTSLPGFDGDDECPITEYHWDFGDGTTGIGKTVKHVYNKPGDYVVTLTVYAPGIPLYIAPQYVGTNTTDTIQHVKHVLPVGGYSFPIAKHTTTTPLATYLTLIAIIATTFTLIRRRQKTEKHKS